MTLMESSYKLKILEGFDGCHFPELQEPLLERTVGQAVAEVAEVAEVAVIEPG